MRKYALAYKYYKIGIEKGFQLSEEKLAKYKKIVALYEKGEKMKRKKKKKSKKACQILQEEGLMLSLFFFAKFYTHVMTNSVAQERI